MVTLPDKMKKNILLAIHRAALPDLPEILDLFETAIKQSCSNDYTPAQIEAWVTSRQIPGRWQTKVENQHFLLARSGQELVGFTSLEDDNYVDVMYVHPNYKGKGVATELLHQLESLAYERGVSKLKSDVSITARPFFEKMGFKVIRKNDNEVRGEVLVNFRMVKKIRPHV